MSELSHVLCRVTEELYLIFCFWNFEVLSFNSHLNNQHDLSYIHKKSIGYESDYLQMYNEWIEALKEAGEDKSVTVAVVTGQL